MIRSKAADGRALWASPVRAIAVQGLCSFLIYFSWSRKWRAAMRTGLALPPFAPPKVPLALENCVFLFFVRTFSKCIGLYQAKMDSKTSMSRFSACGGPVG